jgi:chromosomal replication initiation ATPase DnaA
MAFNDIAKELNRNHSTISISYSDIQEAMNTNSDLKETIEDIIKNLKVFD